MKATTRADAPVVIEGDGVQVRLQELGGGMSAGFVSLPAGADLRPATKGLPDDLCQCPHWGYVLKGRVKMHTRNGATVYPGGARGLRVRGLLADRRVQPRHRSHQGTGLSGVRPITGRRNKTIRSQS